jgi:hypothetical protein
MSNVADDDDFVYKMGEEDEEDELEESAEDLEYQESEDIDSPITPDLHLVNSEEALDYYVETALDFANLVKMANPKLRHELFDTRLQQLATLNGMTLDALLLSSNQDDTKYNSIVGGLYPALKQHLEKVLNSTSRDLLVKSLGISLSVTIWEAIGVALEKSDMTEDDLHSTFGLQHGMATFKTDIPVSDFVSDNALNAYDIDADSASPTMVVVRENLKILKQIVDGITRNASPAEAISEPPVIEESNVDPMVVRAIVNDIMNVYDKLYAPCYVNRPLGILTSKGILTLDKENKPQILGLGTAEYSKRLYSEFKNFSSNYLPEETTTKVIDASFLSSNGSLTNVYSPMFHLRNIYGVKDDGTVAARWVDFKSYLYKDIFRKVSNVLSHFEDDSIGVQMALKELFTNCIIIDTLDRTKSMQLRALVEGLKGGLGGHILRNSKTIFATSTGMVLSETNDSLNIRSLLYVFDENAYKNEILFSYKAYEKLINSGLQPSAKNVVVGRGLNGEDITENFDDEGNILIGIIAGSRSGKGVVTLNILASLYADDCPVFYLDFKPDMSATLWDMEKSLNARGHNAKIFAIDSKANLRKDGVTPVRQFPYGLNAPSGLGLETSHFALMPYLKTMQFACMLAKLRATGVLPSKSKMVFVLDEAQKLNKTYASALEKLQKVLVRTKPKGADAPSAEYSYAEKYLDVFMDGLTNGIGVLRDTDGGSGRVSILLLGQKADPGEWGLFSARDWRSGVFGMMAGTLNTKFIGRQAGTSIDYAMPKINFNGKSHLTEGDRGYFLRVRDAKVSTQAAEDLQIIKSYLVLNKNDFNYEDYKSGNVDKTSFTGGLLTNISDDALADSIVRGDFLNEDESIRDSIGFDGLMKLIMGGAANSEAEIARKMSISYVLMSEVFTKMGLSSRYSTLEEYLYDCSLESIFSLDELLDMYSGISGVRNSDESSIPVDMFNNNRTNQTDITSPIIGSDLDTLEGSNADLYEDAFDTMPNEELDQQPRPEGTPNQPTVEKTQPSSPRVTPSNSTVETEPSTRPNNQSGYSGVYTEELQMRQNPFQIFGILNKPISVLNSIKMMSKMMMDEIKRFAGDYNMVESFEVTEKGLIINNIAFKPFIPDHIIESMPFTMRAQVASGNLAELFHFENLRHFKNLSVLRIDNSRLAEGRVRREVGLSPNQDWYSLFSKYRSLRELYIGGKPITDAASSKEYEDSGRGGFSLTEKLRNIFKLPASIVSNSRMEGMWNSGPVKVATGAVGWTLGVKAVALAASFFGPWGLLMGAFAGYGAYKQFKKNK